MNRDDKFADELIRGISTKDGVVSGFVTASAFQFNPQKREDEFGEEASINWLDDDGAIKEALNKKKQNGNKQFIYICQLSITSHAKAWRLV